MNIVKTGMLLAAMTALFLGVGYLIGGTGGALIALVFALGTNAYAYWNSDKLALRVHRARPVTRASAPEFVGLIEELARKAELPMPGVYIIESEQPNAFATGRNPENAAVAATTGLIRIAVARGAGGRHGARAGACEEPRHADHDGGGDGGGRDLDAGAVRLFLRRHGQ